MTIFGHFTIPNVKELKLCLNYPFNLGANSLNVTVSETNMLCTSHAYSCMYALHPYIKKHIKLTVCCTLFIQCMGFTKRHLIFTDYNTS